MAYDIVLGRSLKDYQKLGTDAAALLGKHYVTMGKTTSLANKIYMDVNSSHIVLICGKRGSGKTYTMGVMAESIIGLQDFVRKNIGMIFFDTMGVYWTTKFPNYRQARLLEDWGLSPEGYPDTTVVYVPEGYYDYYKEKNVPVDKPFTINPSDLSAPEWAMVFNTTLSSEVGVAIEKAVNSIKKKKDNYGLDKIKETILEDKDIEKRIRIAAANRFEGAKEWGVFSKEATPLDELVKRGKMSVIDISIYAGATGGFDVRSMVIGLISRRLLETRMVARKIEELATVQSSYTYFGAGKKKKEKVDYEEEAKKEIPLVWVFVDEAHEFLPPPDEGTTLATMPLVMILREGRQPGVNLVMATQQPAKIRIDAITQADIVLSHRLTADADIQALARVMGAYASGGVTKQMKDLPKLKGSALVMDDLGEKVYPMQVRPRITWHGGSSPEALPPGYTTEEKVEMY